jgi:site-specific DNA-cytosine methylase
MESDSDRPTPWQALESVPFVTCIGGLRLGTVFCGIGTPAWALKVMSVNVDHVFSCDKLPATAKIATHLGVKHKYSDIVDRPDPPDVDLYIFGPPGQSFSKGGKKLGTTDPANGTLTLRSLQYIVEHKPPMILKEQVPAILQEKHRELMDLVEATLKEAGYHLTIQVCQSTQFGAPQRRERLYMAGALRGPVVFGLPPCRMTNLSMVVNPLPPSSFCMLPSSDNASLRPIKIVEEHLAKHVAAGTNVFTTPIIISAGSSDDFAHSEMCIAMTVTKSEATRRGYWCTSKGGFLDADEIALLQGFPRGLIPRRHLKISEPQLCGMIGNAMTLPVIVCLLPSLLFAGGKVDARTARELQQRAQNFRLVE